MKSTAITAILLGVSLFIAACVYIAAGVCNPDRGIICVDNYPHAVVICGEVTTINPGHERDPEIEQLFQKAERLCPKNDK